MPVLTRRSLRVATLLAAVLAAACGGRGTTAGDDALKRDLDAAAGDGLALAPRASRTQVVSAVELGDGRADPAGAPAPAPTGAVARRVTPARAAAPRAIPVRVIERVRYVDRVVERPAPEPERAEPASAPEPAAAPAEPVVVAAPSPGSRRLPQPVDEPARGRGRRGTWDMGDVIRNAPFPINP